MRGFVSYIVRGRRQAIVAATLTAVASALTAPALLVFLPLVLVTLALYLASAAVIALVTLRYGLAEGAKVMIGPAVFWSLPLILSGGSDVSTAALAAPAASALGTTLVPVLLVSAVLRATRSQGIMLLSAALLVGVGALAMHVADVQPSRWLLEELRPAFERAFPEADWSASPPAESGPVPPAWRVGLAAGLQAGNLVVMLALTVLLARWWHAGLDNPGGFGREFRALRNDRRLTIVAVVLIGLAALMRSGPGLLLVPPLLVLFLFQGLAVAHALAQRHRAGRGLLVALYALLVLPQVSFFGVLAVTAAGMVDTWVDFRRRLGA